MADKIITNNIIYSQCTGCFKKITSKSSLNKSKTKSNRKL